MASTLRERKKLLKQNNLKAKVTERIDELCCHIMRVFPIIDPHENIAPHYGMFTMIWWGGGGREGALGYLTTIYVAFCIFVVTGPPVEDWLPPNTLVFQG